MLFAVVLLTLIAGINCQLFPNAAQTTCYSNYLQNNFLSEEVSRINVACATLNPTDPLAACSNQACLNALDPVFRGVCGYDIISKCAIFPTPSPEQSDCLADAFDSRLDRIRSACGTTDFSAPDALLQYCPNEDCFKVGDEIYRSCNYDVLDLVCGDAGKILAAPMLILVFALISVLL